MKTPPPITTDPQGKVSNFSQITKWAYVNDPTFRKTHSISDLIQESYVARLERHVVTQIHALHAIRTAQVEQAAPVTRPPLVLTPTVCLTVTSASDAHEDTVEDTGHAGAVALALFAAAIIGAGIYAHLTGHTWIAAGCYGLAAGSVYGMFRKPKLHH